MDPPHVPSARHLLDLATRSFGRGHLDESFSAIYAALARAPAMAEGWRLLSRLHSSRGAYEEALAAAASAVTLDGNDPGCRATYAQTLIDCRHFLEARRYLNDLGIADDTVLLEIWGMLELGVGDPFMGVDLIESAVTHGLVLPTHVAAAVCTLYAFMGRFEAVDRLLATNKTTADIRAWAERLRYARARGVARFGSDAMDADELVKRSADSLVERNFEDVAYLIQLLFCHPQAQAEHYVHVSHVAFSLAGQGYLETAELINKALGAAMFRVSPTQDGIFRYAQSLMQQQAFRNAGHLLAGLLGRMPGGSDRTAALRMIVMTYKCGELTPEDRDLAVASIRNLETDRLFLRHLVVAGGGISGMNIPNGDASVVIRCGYRRRTTRPLRVALCLFGQLRGFRRAWHRSRLALADWDCTVFVSTWPAVGGGVGSRNTLERVYPPTLWALLPTELRLTDNVSRLFPSLYRRILDGDQVTVEDLTQLYRNSQVALHDEESFERAWSGERRLLIGGSLNQAKMFFTMSRALEMVQSCEDITGRVFDIVIRTRADRAIDQVSDYDVQMALERDVYLTDHFYGWAAGDQTSISNSHIAERVSRIWPQIAAHRGFDFLADGSGRAAEWLVGEYLVDCGLEIGRLRKSRFSELLSPQIDYSSIVSGLEDDLVANGAVTPEIRAFSDALDEAMCRDGFAPSLRLSVK